MNILEGDFIPLTKPLTKETTMTTTLYRAGTPAGFCVPADTLNLKTPAFDGTENLVVLSGGFAHEVRWVETSETGARFVNYWAGPAPTGAFWQTSYVPQNNLRAVK